MQRQTRVSIMMIAAATEAPTATARTFNKILLKNGAVKL